MKKSHFELDIDFSNLLALQGTSPALLPIFLPPLPPSPLKTIASLIQF